MSITRRPWFWIAHSLFFLLCLAYTWRNFEGAFPFVDIQVKMDRPAAMREAAALATRHGWAPASGRREAASFDTDSATTNFIELEAGGAAALKQVLAAGTYMPYTWHVRHFAEGKTQETEIWFTPEGKPYGFSEKLAEQDPGAALKTEAARNIAERAAVDEWGVDLKAYTLAEKASETRKSGRVDHALVYERAGEKIGEGRYRLRLEVSGDRLTELKRQVKVPDAFFRRYATMRSANNSIAELAGALIVILYGLGLCGLGLYYLARAHWVIWRAPVLFAGLIAGLHFAEGLNRFPLGWMQYDTAIETSAFALRHVTSVFIGAIFDFLMVAIPLIVAEAMSRKAFARQPQLARMFSFGPDGGAASRQTLGRVVGAYLFVGFHFAWVTWMYRTGSQKLGWWNPSELLFHPDALATYLPWLTSVASSLHAGVWEECLFRAVPLAGAALLGARYGRRAGWIAGAFILQALIFGAAHASYPTQPSYARVVELLVPSTVFGGMYLAFGLLPGVIMHFTYDVVLFAMPVFLSSGATARLSQILIVLLGLLPLWLVLLARLKAGSWHELPASLYNGAWAPSAPSARLDAVPANALGVKALTRGQWRVLLLSGLVGLGLWLGLGSFTADAPSLKLSRTEAIAVARQGLQDRGVMLGPEWRPLASVDADPGEAEDFVWRESGEETYRALLGSFLDPPLWRIRFVKFGGDLVERAEEHQVFILGSGEIQRVRHELPESRAGKALGETEAKAIAIRALKDRYGAVLSRLKEVSSNQYQLPARRDWLFVWSDPGVPLKQGEARLAVKIAGDEVTGSRRYVHVPEDWTRTERGRKTAMSVAKMLGGTVFSVFLIFLIVGTFQGLIKGHFNRKVFWGVLGGGLLLELMLKLNEFALVEATFKTSQPWASQVFRAVVSGGLSALAGTALLAVFIGHIQAASSGDGEPASRHRLYGLGCAAGSWLAAMAAVAARLGKAEHPLWPSFGAAAASFPWLEAFRGISLYLGGAAFLQLLYPWIARHCATPARKAAVYALLGLAFGSFMAESTLLELLGAGLAAGLSLFLIGELVRRTSPAILISLSGAVAILRAARVAEVHAYPGALGAGILLAASVALVSWFWLSEGRFFAKTSVENGGAG
jgi:hypothetical protein